jgi:hypothetical protein
MSLSVLDREITVPLIDIRTPFYDDLQRWYPDREAAQRIDLDAENRRLVAELRKMSARASVAEQRLDSVVAMMRDLNTASQRPVHVTASDSNALTVQAIRDYVPPAAAIEAAVEKTDYFTAPLETSIEPQPGRIRRLGRRIRNVWYRIQLTGVTW